LKNGETTILNPIITLISVPLNPYKGPCTIEEVEIYRKTFRTTAQKVHKKEKSNTELTNFMQHSSS